MKLGILGGGPAGMFAAIEASKKGMQVSIIDNNLVLGRKLSVTGGGRGNLTNLGIRPEVYYSQDLKQKENLEKILTKYDANFLLKYFYQLGIPTYHTDDGWVYPISNSAKNLSYYLSKILQEYKITHIPDTFIDDLRVFPQHISLYGLNNQEFKFNRVIIATGGNAYPQVGASTKILQALEKLGYQIKPIYPALAPLKTTKKRTFNLKGLRFNALCTLQSGNSIIKSEHGNIIFTEWGLNGPGVMNLSHYFYLYPNKLTITINPLIIFKNEIQDSIQNHHNQNLKFRVFLLSYIPEGLIAQYQKNQNILLNKSLNEIQQIPMEDLIQAFDLKEDVIGTREFKFAQLSTGGILLDQVNLLTMKSTLHNNLSFAGEILDIVGPCGGYNLHWAFISGLIAGKHI